MRITIINTEKNEKRYTREELEEFIAQLKNGVFRQESTRDAKKKVCFAAENIMKRLEKAFPTFIVRKYTDKELGHTLSNMGYEYKKQNKGASYRMKEK